MRSHIMNRFSSDMDAVDTKIPKNLFEAYMSVVYVIAALIAIGVVKPWFLVVLPVVLILQWGLQVSWKLSALKVCMVALDIDSFLSIYPHVSLRGRNFVVFNCVCLDIQMNKTIYFQEIIFTLKKLITADKMRSC